MFTYVTAFLIWFGFSIIYFGGASKSGNHIDNIMFALGGSLLTAGVEFPIIIPIIDYIENNFE